MFKIHVQGKVYLFEIDPSLGGYQGHVTDDVEFEELDPDSESGWQDGTAAPEASCFGVSTDGTTYKEFRSQSSRLDAGFHQCSEPITEFATYVEAYDSPGFPR